MSELIRASNVSVEGPDGYIVEPLELEVPTGLTVIVGPSGSGKSTLVNTLFGLRKPDSGVVEHFDESGSITFQNATYHNATIGSRLMSALRTESREDRKAAHYRSKYLGYIAQTPHLHPELPAGEYVSLVQAARGNKIDASRTGRLFEMLGVDQHAHKTVQQLSGGERQRFAIISALAHEPRLVAADEPTSALDSVSTVKVMNLFRELADEGKTSVVMVSHDEKTLPYADTIVRMLDGKIIAVDKK